MLINVLQFIPLARAILLKVSPDFTVYEPPVEVFELVDVDELVELLLELLDVLLEEELFELEEPETFKL